MNKEDIKTVNRLLNQKGRRPSYLKILQLLAEGYTAKETGNKLNVSFKTIEARVSYLKTAFEAKNIPHLVAKAIRMKVIK